jgi:putative transposase
MPRVARDIVVGVPHHITPRGNLRQDVFFTDADRLQYLLHMKDYSGRYGLNALAYCLMTNHVHIVTVPLKSDSLALTMRIVDTRHSQMINAEFG